jgi:adenylate cyclase
MADEGFKRKLAAILSADVIGYSRLMRDDEEATVRGIASHRVLVSDIVQQHHGRVVDSPGDNILAEFASVVDAVNGAIKIQEEIRKSTEDTPEDRRMEFRIGINLGDVIEEEERIYGDGVNIAARVEGLATGGGIAISGTVFEHIKEKLSLGYHYLGEQDVKNISEPVRVYRLLTGPENVGKMIGEGKPKSGKSRHIAFGALSLFILLAGILVVWSSYFRTEIEPASVEKMAYPLPDKPSIAVLPFDNMSGDPEQEYFSDGLTDQIISTLSKLRNLFVIARNSTFTYKGKPIKIQKVSEDLGVKYILEGSVQRTADRIRVTAQLIDATTGHHVWSERYDREQEDIFDIQDDLTMEITKALGIELIEGEQARIWQKNQTSNLSAYEKVLQGRQYLLKQNKEDSARARSYYEEAMALDPNYARPYIGLGWIHWQGARYGWAESPKKSIKMAYEYAQKAIKLDNNSDSAHILMGSIYLLKRRYEKAVEQVERAIAISPNSATNNSFLGGFLGCAGRWEEGLGYAEMSIRLSPNPPSFYYWILGRAYFMTGQYDKTIETFKKAVYIDPDFLIAHAFLAACYSSLGRQAEAASEADEVLRINPQFTLEAYAKTLPYKKKADIDRYIAALRKAGLPYTPHLPLPDKPSIAVLAFDNLSGDPEQEYFSDGIAENIITALSKVGELFVIARNSSFTYKGKPVKIQQIGRELGVRYVVEGSVQKSGDRVRITAQLVDAKNGQHIWAENYDRDLKDIFEIQDEITMKVVTALRIELTEGEQARVWAKQVKNLDVYLKAAQWKSARGEGTKEGVQRCGQLAKEIIEIEPDHPIGYRLLGWYYWQLAMRNISPRESIQKGFEFTQKALTMDDSDELSHAVLGHIYLKMKNYEKAVESGKRSVELLPNGAMVHTLLGRTLCDAGQLGEGIASIKQGHRLNPFPDYWYYTYLGNCYNQKGQYEDALTQYKKALQLAPESPQIHGGLSVIYILLGREEEARASATKSLEFAPHASVSLISKTSTVNNQAFKELVADSMRKAGFPE